MAPDKPRIRKALERPVEIAVAAIALLGLPKLWVGVFPDDAPALLVGIALLGVTHLVVAVDCLWLRRRLSWLIVGLTVLGTALIVGVQLLGPEDGGIWRTDAWFGTILTYVILLLHRRPQMPVVLAVYVGGLVVLGFTRDLGLVAQLLGLMYTASGIGVLWVARLVTIVIAEDYLASRRRRAGQQQEASEEAARAEALAGLRREMHDSLLHTLQRMGAPWSAASDDEVREACREAKHRLVQGPAQLPEDSPVDVGAALREALPHDRQVIVVEPEQILVPRAVADALVGATREAVRNALKYAPSSPQVLLTQRGDSVRVRVSDDGPGFDVDSQREQSLGLQGSVLHRMSAVGGEASVRSGGDGTIVRLRWPAEPPPAKGLSLRARRLVSWLPLPLVGASLFHVLVMGWPDMIVPLGITMVITVAILVGGRLERRGGLAPWQASALCFLGMAAFVYNYLDVGSGPSTDYDLWAPSLVSAVLIIAITGQKVRVAVPLAVLVVVGAVTVSGMSVGWEATANSHFGGILAVLLYTIVTLVLVIGATGVSRHLHVTRRLAVAAELRALTHRVRDAVWVGWLDRAEELTGQFLSDVAEGRLDPSAPGTRATAARLGARIRDELRLWPGPLGLAAELDRLRGLGWDARLLGGEFGALEDDEVVALLARFAEPPADGAQLMVTAEPSGATLTLTPALDLEGECELRDWLSIEDPEFTQFRTRQKERV